MVSCVCTFQPSDIPLREGAKPNPNISDCYNLPMPLNDLEFAYSPVRNAVRDLREYL